MHVESLDGDARDALASVAARKRALALQMSRHRMKILAAGLALQLATCMFGFCSMVSGWYGMNLDNGTCGPDGCNAGGVLASDAAIAAWNACVAGGGGAGCGPQPVPFQATDHGYSNFLGVVLGSTCAAVIAAGSAWVYISRRF